MKKVLIGCGVLAMLCVVVMCGSGIFIFYKAKNMAVRMGQVATTTQQGIEEANAEFPFIEPAGIEFNEERFNAMIDARVAIAESIRSTSIYTTVKKSIDAQNAGNQEEADKQALNIIKSMLTSGLSAMETVSKGYIEALKANEISMDEYLYYTEISIAMFTLEKKKSANKATEDADKMPQEADSAITQISNNPELRNKLNFNLSSRESQWKEVSEVKYNEAKEAIKSVSKNMEAFSESIFADMFLKELNKNTQGGVRY